MVSMLGKCQRKISYDTHTHTHIHCLTTCILFYYYLLIITTAKKTIIAVGIHRFRLISHRYYSLFITFAELIFAFILLHNNNKSFKPFVCEFVEGEEELKKDNQTHRIETGRRRRRERDREKKCVYCRKFVHNRLKNMRYHLLCH